MSTRRKQLYSLFEKRDGKWVNISPLSFYLPTARRVFQNALLFGSFTGHVRELRVTTR